MSTVILACSTLEEYVNAAQKKMKTNYPVVLLDKKYHVEPKDMQKHILDNEYDKEAIRVELEGLGKIGYVRTVPIRCW